MGPGRVVVAEVTPNTNVEDGRGTEGGLGGGLCVRQGVYVGLPQKVP